MDTARSEDGFIFLFAHLFIKSFIIHIAVPGTQNLRSVPHYMNSAVRLLQELPLVDGIDQN